MNNNYNTNNNKDQLNIKPNNDQKKLIRELVSYYFLINPNMNRGIAFKSKANDIILSYLLIHNKSFEEIKHCIDSYPMTNIPIWTQFDNYFNKRPNNNKSKSNYKDSISDSTNVDDWL